MRSLRESVLGNPHCVSRDGKQGLPSTEEIESATHSRSPWPLAAWAQASDLSSANLRILSRTLNLEPVLQRSKGQFQICSDGSSCGIKVVIGSGWWWQCQDSMSSVGWQRHWPSLFLWFELGWDLDPNFPSVSDCFQAWFTSLPINSACYLISCQWISFLLRLTRVGFCWLQLRTLFTQCLKLDRHSTNICWICFLLTWNYSARSLMFFHPGCCSLMASSLFRYLKAFLGGFEGQKKEVNSWSTCHPNFTGINILTHG